APWSIHYIGARQMPLSSSDPRRAVVVLMGARLHLYSEYRAADYEHLLPVAVKEAGPVQLRIQPVGIERIDGVDLTPRQARMLAAVLNQAADIYEKGITP